MSQKESGFKITVFASGTGSNFKSIVDAIDDGTLKAEVAGVISNNPDAGAIEFAKNRCFNWAIVNKKRYPDTEEHDNKLMSLLQEWKTDLIVLAGYMKKIPTGIVAKFKNKILNIHPALLPSFGGKGMYGMRVHETVIDYGVKYSGVTVHLVDNEFDSGPIVLQQTVPVFDDDTPEKLQKRILIEEHKIYKKAIQLFAENRIEISGRRVIAKRDHAGN